MCLCIKTIDYEIQAFLSYIISNNHRTVIYHAVVIITENEWSLFPYDALFRHTNYIVWTMGF